MRPAAILGVMLSIAGHGHALAQAPQANFSDSERLRLASGQLVSRPLAKLIRGQRLVGGISWQKIDQPADVVWRTALDTNSYQYLFPKLVSAKLMSQQSNTRTVIMHHQYGPFDVRYTLEFSLTPHRRDMQFRMLSTEHPMLKTLWGFMTVIPDGDGACILCYGVMGDIGSGSIQGWARPYLQAKLLRVPDYFRRFLERRT